MANIPTELPYVNADPAHVERWQKELGGSPALKIGIGWQGNPSHRFDQHRSIPLQSFAALAARAGVELYSLQKGPGTEQLKTARFPVIDLDSRLDETGGAFTQTAAAMKALDLVVVCDSALAHLAGAMGIPVWLVLSTPADWRWMQEIADTPWYPSMRIFRQEKLGQWGPVFADMANALGALTLQKRATSIQMEVAPGELLDKLTILQIKSERITEADKLRNVRAELAVVEATRRQNIREVAGVEDLLHQLKKVNEGLWDIENDIRDREKAADFGSDFIRLARAVYQTNDRRAVVKRQLNELLGANFREEKEYHGY